jgi:uncharacterized membrane protein
MAGDIRYISAGPLSAFAIILVIGLILLLIPLLFLGVIGAAFTRLGLSWIAALALVLLMLTGSIVNIPLHRIRRDVVRAAHLDPSGNELYSPFGAPVWETTIAINLGGGIIPVCIAAYLMFQAVTVSGTALLLPVALCAAIVSGVAFISAQEIGDFGIQVPVFIPALAALLTGLLLSGGTGLTAAVTALAGGVLGTLIGGNLAHLRCVPDLEVPIVSIGGSGTFGAVFLCCVLPSIIA